MRLPSLFSKKNPTKKYLVILISDHAVRASLVEVADSGVIVLSQSQTNQYADKQAFILQTDAALQELSGEAEKVEEVIFALESNWVNEEGIIDIKKPLLKDLTTQLSLKAVGFVVIPEAIIQAYSEGQTPSSLLVQVNNEKVGLYLVQQGIIQKAETVGRSHEHIGDVFEGIARFTQDLKGAGTLPGTIILTSFEVSREELETMRQALVNADWASQKVFLQQPVIQLVAPTQITEMVGVKGGEAVARAQGLAIMQTNGSLHSQNQTVTDQPAPTSFGIPITSDNTVSLPPDAEELELEQQTVTQSIQQEKKKKLIRMITVGVILGIFVVCIVFFFIVRATAQAIVVVTPKLSAVTKELEITVDSTADASDPEALLLAGEMTSVTVEGEDALATTGRKLIGDPAKGTVTVFNKTTAEKIFSKGTELKSGELTYTLDSDITVPAAEVTEQNPGESTSKFGKTTVNITATAIGEEGNIKKDVKLSIGNFASNTYEAVVNEDLKGGSSREVRVISDEDRKKVLESLRAELLKSGQDKLQSEAQTGQYILPTQSITVSQVEYSGEVSDEANEVRVSATGTVKAIAYSAEDLKPLTAKALESEIPVGYSLVDEEPQVLSAPLEGEEASASAQKLTLNVSSRAKPQLDESSIENVVMGKTLPDAQSALSNNQQIESVEIRFVPALAKNFGAMISKDPEKIKVEFK